MSDSLRYALTDDGYKIAYAVSGQGRPLLFTPCILQGNIADHPASRSRFLHELEQRFQVVRYDGRGTGNSTRGLSEDTSVEDTALDIYALVKELGLRDFVLYGDVFSTYPLLLAAIELQPLLKAVVLMSPVAYEGDPLMQAWSEMYTSNWEVFTNTFVSTFFDTGVTGDAMRGWVNQEDFVRLALSAEGRRLADIIDRVKTPALVFAPREPVNPIHSRTAREIVSSIPNSRLVMYDGYRLSTLMEVGDNERSPALVAIEEFLSSLPSAPGATSSMYGEVRLSSREIEVLRLIAGGRSNQQIANELVISPSTVAKHVTSILTKTESQNRAEATSYAHRRGLL